MDTDGPSTPPDETGTRRSDRVEAVRRAVDQALTATAGTTRTRAQDLADELGQVVGRVRGALEDLGSAGTSQAGALADEVQQAVGRLGRTLDARPASAEEVRRLSERIEALERRLERVEAAPSTARTPSTDGPHAPDPAP